MRCYFFDTSAIVKRYVAELGSTWVIELMTTSPVPSVIIAQATLVELVSALARRQREGSINPKDFIAQRNSFLYHAKTQYQTIRFTNLVIAQAQRLVGQYPLRAFDAIQLASALTAQARLKNPCIFVGCDQRLLEAAKAENLEVENPQVYV